MGWSVAFAPVLPLWLIAALAGVGLLLILLGLLRRVRGTWIRTAALVALVLALMNPIIQREEREGLPTVVAMVVDKSPSQSLDGRDETTEAARAELAQRFADFDDIELREIDAGAFTRGITTDGTQLFGAPTARSTTCPRTAPVSWEARRSTLFSPAAKASATGASSSTAPRASASSARSRPSSIASSTTGRPVLRR
jgi:hypothetical protein